MEFLGCPCTGKTLARLVRPAVLTLLAGEAMHGYEVLRRLGTMRLFRGQAPDATGVYRTLREMEAEGLVVGTWDTGGHGPAKRRYAVTDAGLACLVRWTQTLAAYQAGLAELLGAARETLGPRPGDDGP